MQVDPIFQWLSHETSRGLHYSGSKYFFFQQSSETKFLAQKSLFWHSIKKEFECQYSLRAIWNKMNLIQRCFWLVIKRKEVSVKEKSFRSWSKIYWKKKTLRCGNTQPKQNLTKGRDFRKTKLLFSNFFQISLIFEARIWKKF